MIPRATMFALLGLAMVTCARRPVPMAVSLSREGALSPWARNLPRHTQYDMQRVARVNISPSVVAQMRDLWEQSDHDGLEGAACLYGPIISDTLFVVVTGVPVYVERTESNVQFRCPLTAEYIGGYHTHHRRPDGTLLMIHGSDDADSFDQDTMALLMVVGVGFDGMGQFRTWAVTRNYKIALMAWATARRSPTNSGEMPP